MTKRRKILWSGVVVSVMLIGACLIGGIFLLRTTWLKDRLQRQMVLALENATGAKVDFQSFGYRWQTWTIDVGRLTMRGTEPADGPPLFRADRIQIRLKLVSFLKRKIDLESIGIERPQVFILVRPDGTTNVPAPAARNPAVDTQLIALAVRRFQMQQGSVQINGREYVFDINARQLQTALWFEPRPAAYRGTFSAQQFKVDSPYNVPLIASLRTGMEFSKDHIALDHFLVTTAGSRLNGSAALDHFAHPVESVDVQGSIDIQEAFSLFRIFELRAGRAEVAGRGTYEAGRYQFTGAVNASGIEYRDDGFRVAGLALQSSVVARNTGLSLTDLRVRGLGASAIGQAALEDYRNVRWRGLVRGLNVREIARFFTTRRLEWDGTANGPFSIQGRLGEHLRNFVVNTDASIVPGSQGVPVSGTVSLVYRQRGNTVELSHSQIHLPNSTLEISGTPGQHLDVNLDSSDLTDAEPAIALLDATGQHMALPVHLSNGHFHFNGSVDGALQSPVIAGQMNAGRLRYQTFLIDNISATFHAASGRVDLQALQLNQSKLQASASGEAVLRNWNLEPDSSMRLTLTARNLDLTALRSELNLQNVPVTGGEMALSAQLTGTRAAPQVLAKIEASNLEVAGQPLDSFAATLQLDSARLAVNDGIVHAFHTSASVQGSYSHGASGWNEGQLDLRAATPGVLFQNLAIAKEWEPGLTGRLETNFHVAGRWSNRHFAPGSIDGQLRLADVALNGIAYGNMTATAKTKQGTLIAGLNGKVGDGDFAGNATVALAGDYAAKADISGQPLKLSNVAAMIPQLKNKSFPFEGIVQGTAALAGPLARPSLLEGSIRLNQLQFAPVFARGPVLQETAAKRAALEEITIRNPEPIVINVRNGQAAIKSFRLTAKDTQLAVTGEFGIGGQFPIDLKVNGDVNLHLLKTFNPSLESAGTSHIDTSITGTIRNPSINGITSVTDASLYGADLTNGLDHANGVIRFDNQRATIQRFTARSGGGRVDVTGLMNFGGDVPAIFRLSANARKVRVRYNGVSVTFDAAVKYTGTVQSSMLAGAVTVTQAAFNPSTDVGNLFAAYSSQPALVSPQNGYLHRVRLELAIQSSSSLQLTTSVSQDVQAEIDLHLRGTPDKPILLGRCSVNEGQIQFFGNKYSINRGEVNFFNPQKVEPVLDLDLQTQASGITINITISGPIEQLNVSYRSDPPLQPNEIIALLATGRTPNATSGYATSQLSQNGFLSAGTNTLLGSAISPVSSRLQRFFGVTHLKIDPLVQGIEDVPQARLTLEQQISPEVSITYVTNLSRTAEQIFRLEWALSREYSVVAIRDENGLFGVDILYKKRFK